MSRQNFTSGTAWEAQVGYSRAVKSGNFIEVAGTTAVINGEVVGVGNLYEQCVCIFQKIEAILHQAGASLNDVVRTRTFVTNIDQWQDFGRAHAEFFGDIKPAATLVEVSRFIHADLLVEIEVSAIIGG